MMKKPLRIGTQLLLGFAILLVFVIVLGTVAYTQTHRIHEQTIIMYEHPLQVRRALGELDSDILTIRLGMQELMLSENDRDVQSALQMMAQAAANAEQQFNIIRRQYLGPQEDIAQAYKAYIAWNTAREESIPLALTGRMSELKERLLPEGMIGAYREDMLKQLHDISLFALNKGDSLYAAADELMDRLTTQLMVLISALLLLTLLISYHLVKSIRKPLTEINDAVLRFHGGDVFSRSLYAKEDEFGVLSSSINALADRVQENAALNQNTVRLSQEMLSQDDAPLFFRAALCALAEFTASQMAAVYLPGEDQAVFELYESLGTDENARRTFRVDSFEGEFGTALYTRRIQHIKNISADTRFVFYTVNGRFIPREIIVIPIISGHSVIAVISLASLGEYTTRAFSLIDSILVTMSTRIEGVLALHRIKQIQHELEQQNRELNAQRHELTIQTTELTQQNTELEMQKNQLNEASRLKTNFLSNMSHELRTPLNSVIALTGVLGRRLAGRIADEEHKYLEVIERNGKNLLTLINDILDISRIEAGHEEADISTFHMKELIVEVADMIRPQADQRNIELRVSLGDSPLIISSDADKCRHILQNLIGNAVKFTQIGTVSIDALETQDHVEIHVCDTGIGIAAEHIPYIFDEFRQGDSSLSRRYGGAGLGLAIAKRFALMLGGDISVKSDPNKGSEFTLCLPLCFDADKPVNSKHISDMPEYSNQPGVQPAAVSAGKTVLLVEDNEVAVIQIKDLVEEMGINMMVARNADEALNLIEHRIPDAMILDLMMPGIDGFKLLEILRNAELTARTPVLILTAKHISKDELRYLKRNNIHQLIRKGDADRAKLQAAISSLFAHGAEQGEKTRAAAQPAGTPVVLVTEDNPDNMLTAKALLADRYAVLEAHDGPECLQMAKKHMPDLILMDIALSGMSGIEAFQEIRNDPSIAHIPIIALTASAMEHEREAILAYGFDAFIPKPIIEEQFISVINEVLYGKRSI